MFTCKCGLNVPVKVFPFYCGCGARWANNETCEVDSRKPLKLKSKPAIARRSHWPELHRYPVEQADSWGADTARAWYRNWCERIPAYGCDCRVNWTNYTKDFPPDFESPRAFFAWSVEAHNFVSVTHVKPRKRAVPLREAEGIYRVPWVATKERGLITSPATDEPMTALADYAKRLNAELIVVDADIIDHVAVHYGWGFERLLQVRSDVKLRQHTPPIFHMHPVGDSFGSRDREVFGDLLFCYLFVKAEYNCPLEVWAGVADDA